MRKALRGVWRDSKSPIQSGLPQSENAETRVSAERPNPETGIATHSHKSSLSKTRNDYDVGNGAAGSGEQSDSTHTLPKSEADARKHIKKICDEKIFSKDLEIAIKIISEELNQKGTHFLLELIQNADDNEYRTSKPTLNITYTPGHLRIDCNEIGFSRDNVEALCRIGQSSKGGSRGASRHIGEKGIGFKSVFKVATAVWIHSGFYSFKLDRREKLGILAPRWADFPGSIIPQHTSFIIQIANKRYEDEVLEELKSLDPKLLLFLRRLKDINIVLAPDDQVTESISLRRRAAPASKPGMQEILLYRNDSSFRFAVARYQVSRLPVDERRGVTGQDKILLAFPLTPSSRPKIEPQNVYAFLPIRDYGFKFIIQADFLLTASREDIDASSAWNQALLNHLPNAILEVVKMFNASGFRYSWISYFDFISVPGSLFERFDVKLFERLRSEPILESNSGALDYPSALTYDVMELAYKDGRSLIPLEMATSTYISPHYPLQENKIFLERIGVDVLTVERFLIELNTFITTYSESFRRMSREWHEYLSAVLLTLASQEAHAEKISALEFVQLQDGTWVAPRNQDLVFPISSNDLKVPKGLPLSEIHSEAWRGVHSRELLVRFGARKLNEDYICKIICQAHSSNNYRLAKSDLISHVKFLYQTKWEPDEGHELWLVSEEGPHCRGKDLYIHSTSPFSASKLLLEDKGKLHLRFLHQGYHSSQGRASEDKKWRDWAVRALGVAEIPRIIVQSDNLAYKISSEFLFLIKNRPWVDTLKLLGTQWKDYSGLFVGIPIPEGKSWHHSPDKDQVRRALRNLITSLNVRCLDGAVAVLSSTYLPRGELLLRANDSDSDSSVSKDLEKHETFDLFIKSPGDCPDENSEMVVLDSSKDQAHQSSGSNQSLDSKKTTELSNLESTLSKRATPADTLPTFNGSGRANPASPDRFFEISYLDVPEPEGEVWDFLQNFGVIVKLHPPSLINRLKQLQGHESVFKEVCSIYEMLERCKKDEDITLIRSAFKESHLILVPSRTPNQPTKWMNTLGVVWDGPSCLKRITRLKDHYIDRQVLFTEVLKVQDANLKTMVAEAKDISPDDPIDHIRALLLCISDVLGESNAGTWQVTMEPLLKYRILPIKKPTSELIDYDYLSSLQDGTEWYVADRMHYTQGFQNQIPLLAFDAHAIEQLEPFMSHFHSEFETHRLSLLVRQSFSEWGTLEPIYDMERNLRLKAPYIAVLASKSKRSTVLRAIEQATVFKAREVEVAYYLFSRHSSQHYEFRESGHAKVTMESETLKVFLTEEALANNDFTLDLMEQLSMTCGLDTTKQHYLNFILREDNLHRITSSLRRKGFQVETPDKVEETSETSITPVGETAMEPPSRKDRTASILSYQELEHSRTPLRKSMSVSKKVKYAVDRGSFTSVENSGLSMRHQGNIITESDSNLQITARESTSFQTQHSSHSSMSTWSQVISRANLTVSEDQLDIRKIPRFTPIARGLELLPQPRVVIPEEDWDAIEFIAELYVSKLFEKKLYQKTYSPNINWMSPMRSRAGHKPYSHTDSENATFQIPDTCGDMLQFLAEMGCREAVALPRTTTYHIDISVTTSGLRSEFLMTPEATQRAQQYSMFKQPLDAPDNVFILARVYNVTVRPEIAFFVDPWQKHLNGLLNLRPQLGYHASFSDLVIGSVLQKGSNNFGDVPSEVYKYRHLAHREVRLMKLNAGAPDEAIKASISHVKVDKAVDFIALSYVWETASSANSPFAVETSEGDVPVTHSLYAALKAIRQPDKPLTLWADAVCINQENHLEKSVQIRLIERIYRAAEQVYAWIGEEKNNSDRIILTLNQVFTDLQVSKDSKLLETAVNADFWKDINSLLSRSWFGRVWIVQELLLPSEVTLICGKARIKWDHFFDAVVRCETFLHETSKVSNQYPGYITHAGPAYVLGLARQRLRKEQQGFSLLELIEMFWYTRATEERDKLFAFLSIAIDVGDRTYDPDYDSELEEIVRRYSKGFVQSGGVMDLLYRSGRSKSYSFCSWIPHWTETGFRSTISDWSTRNGKFYAGKQSPPQARVLDGDLFVLEVQGCTLDSIQSVIQQPFNQSQPGTSNIVITFIGLIKKSLEHMEKYPTQEKIEDVLVWLPIGNAARPEGTPGALFAEYRPFQSVPDEDWPTSLKEQVLSIDTRQDISTFSNKPADFKETILKYWATAEVFLSKFDEATFCVTKQGRAGIVPGKAEPGDLICTFHGGRVPFVVRKQEVPQSPEVYELIGECYVHGIMHGEGLSSGTKDRKFNLV